MVTHNFVIQKNMATHRYVGDKKDQLRHGKTLKSF